MTVQKMVVFNFEKWKLKLKTRRNNRGTSISPVDVIIAPTPKYSLIPVSLWNSGGNLVLTHTNQEQG